MPSSLYTIDVGPRLNDGSREVTLVQEGTPFFSVRHREVTSAFLAFFPSAQDTSPHNAHKGEKAAPSLGITDPVSRSVASKPLPLQSGIPAEVMDAILPCGAPPSLASHVATAEDDYCEYLCVFHLEELCDGRGYYEAGHPQTLCSAYRARDGTFTELALHNLDLSRMIPGLSGVIVHGTLARVDRPSDIPPPLSVAGDILYPTADLWWMASPLVVRPVYVSSATAQALLTSATSSAFGAGAAMSSPDKRRRSLFADLSSTMSSEAPSAAQGRRTEPGGGDGSRAGFPATVAPPAYANESDALYLDTEVIGQFRGPCGGCYALARTSAQDVRLARVTSHPALDILCWDWLPQSCELPGLGEVETAALTLVVPESTEATVQILFVTAASQDRTWVLRTPNLLSGSGALESILMLSLGVPPVVLPCVRSRTTPPVLLCNSPREGLISVMDMPALLHFDLGNGRVSAGQMESLLLCSAALDSVASAQHDPLDGLREGQQRGHSNINDGAADGARSTSPCSVHEGHAASADGASARGLGRQSSGAATTSTPNPGARIESVSLVRGGQLVFTTTRSAATSSPMSDAGVQWRRCEVSCEQTVTVPRTTGPAETFLVIILDALEAALGADAAATVEYAYLHARWQHMDVPVDSLATVAELTTATLLRMVEGSVSAPHAATPTHTPSTSVKGEQRATMQQRLTAALRDSAPLNSSTVKHLSTLLELPHQTITPTKEIRTGLAAPWSRAMCELALMTLHQLCQSCTLQERYWPLVQPLSHLVLLVSQRLGRDAYTAYYGLTLPSRDLSCTAPTVATAPSPPPLSSEDVDALSELAHQRCVWVTQTNVAESVLGAPPLLRRIFQHIVRGGAATNSPGRFASSLTAMGTLSVWPLLRELPLEHPLSVANRVLCLLVTCFVGWPTPPPIAANAGLTQEEADAHVSNNNKEAVTSDTIAMDSEADDSGANTPTADASPQMVAHSSHGCAVWWYTLCEWLPRLYLSAAEVRGQLSLGTGFPISQALACAKESPAAEWNEMMYAVVGRIDCIREPALLNALTDHSRSLIRVTEERSTAHSPRGTLIDADDGVSLRPDFQKTWADARLDIPQVFFNTAAPISLPSQVDGSDELFTTLATLSRSAMSLPMGRGMLTMNTQNFKSRDSIPVPLLNLNGVTSDGVHVTNNAEELATERLLWPSLHNGCAAGFRFLPLCAAAAAATGSGGRSGTGASSASLSSSSEKESAITRQWVVYQTRSISPPPARAGMLLAAGVLGHLRVLQLTDIYALLVTQQPNYAWRELTTTAVLLGLGCSFRGTGSDLIFRCLSMHVRSLTPTNEDIEVSLDVQTAALLSMGMLCQQMPSNVFLVEMFLQEMSRLPSDEHCMKREGYAVAAGMGLGLLLLGVGDTHAVPHVEERLFAFMVGAHREPPPSLNQGASALNELGHDRDHFLTRTLLAQSAAASLSGNTCNRVYEGAHYNLAVTAPAAVMALGMVYLQTESELVATQLAPPDRLVALQSVSPTLCLLRSMMAPLVRWCSIEPTRQWLYAHVPQRLVNLGKHGHATLSLAQQQVNYLLLNLGHCVAGAAMALGLRYAGSMDADARLTILSELQGFASGFVGSTGVPMTTFQKSTGAFEKCIATCAVAVSLVMAGGGDLKVLAELRKLHSRNVSHADTYGTNMAIASAIGLLFLGSGRLTLSNTRPSVAALLIAFYPLWPTSAEDNVRHLQGFRHLYALAVVPRLMETMDAVTGRPVSVPIRLVLSKGRIQTKGGAAGALPVDQHVLWTPVPRGKEEQEVCLQTPCLLPPSDTVDFVEIRSATHYPLVITNHDGRIISDRGLVVRVLEKQDARDTLRGRGAVAQGFAEVRVLDWLQQLVHCHNARRTPQALIILDELALLLTWSPTLTTQTARRSSSPSSAHQRFASGGSRTSTASLVMEPHLLLRHDFLLAVRDVLEERYNFLFFRGPPGTHTGHPLHALLIACCSVDTVLDRVASQPTGTPSFPCDFVTLMRQPRRASDVERDKDCHGESSSSPVVARAWMLEALCFFRVTPLLFDLRTLLAQEQTRLTQATTHRLALLKMNQTLSLPMRTLESIVQCCFGL